jgi:hypothetical protein
MIWGLLGLVAISGVGASMIWGLLGLVAISGLGASVIWGMLGLVAISRMGSSMIWRLLGHVALNGVGSWSFSDHDAGATDLKITGAAVLETESSVAGACGCTI